jgi:Cytochrome c biogenesis factor
MIYIFLFFTALIYFFFLIKNSGEESRIKVQNKFIIITSLSLSFLFMIYFFNNSFIQDRDEIQRISQKHEKLRNDIVKIKSNIPSLIEKLERMPDYYVGWVMLARSYQLTGDKISASIAFDKALKIRDDEIDIIQEYIYLLKDLDPKRNKNKITKLFDKIITSNSNNINTYNMLLNYSVEINDIELTRNTLEKIINETDIENKKPYIDALNQISSQSNFGFTVRLSSNWIKSYNQMKHIFIILKENNMPPIAVKRVLGED